MQRIGLYGGSFNPVTCAHLLVALAAREELCLDRLFFIPAAQSPFKPDQIIAPAAERLRWLRLALAGNHWCAVDDQEIRRGGVSYSIDTVRHYAVEYPDAELFYLVGADHAADLPHWREAETLAQMTRFAVVPRPGQGGILVPKPFRGITLCGFPFEISASVVRARLKAGKTVTGLVPAAVEEALEKSKLYFY
jgi:nicotinate-nucleotide adenylyltransferase